MSTLVPPKLLLLDEHTAALDPATARKVMAITHQIVERSQITTMMITHDMHLMLEYTSHAIVISGGKKIGDASAVEILTNEEIAEQANLKVTSLYELAKLTGIEDAQGFVQKFIDYERRNMRA